MSISMKLSSWLLMGAMSLSSLAFIPSTLARGVVEPQTRAAVSPGGLPLRYFAGKSGI